MGQYLQQGCVSITKTQANLVQQLQNYHNKSMQSQLQPAAYPQTEQQVSQMHKSRAQNSHISIDSQMIRNKQQLLQKYYQLAQYNIAANHESKLQIIRQWPNQSLQEVVQGISEIHKTNNAEYFGMCSNQMFHGYGLMIYQQMQLTETHQTSYLSTQTGNKAKLAKNKNTQGVKPSIAVGRFYEGEFQNNCKHGYGLQYIAGNIYIGKFINNKPEDVNGIFLWQNGDLYMGSFVNGMKHGMGRWESGTDYYEGTWKLNRPEGLGKIHTTASEYEGDVKNGYKHGRGLEIFSNGDRYEGLYANGKPEGDGMYCWKNGAVYKGQFKNGIRYGYGNWSFGNQSYEGDYINDKRNGQGVYKWGGGSYYKGQFMDDLRHGFGQMHWNQNSYYKGEWREGSQSGEGQIWEDGKLISKGTFQEGKLIKQPNKLQKSHITQKSHNQNNYQPQKNSAHQKISRNNRSEQKNSASTRYPIIQRKQRTRNNSHYQNLSQIDEFPKVHKHKKYIVSTSFSNHTKFSGNTTMNQSFQPNNQKQRKDFQQQTSSHFSSKKKQFLIETPMKLPQQKISQTSSKKLSFQKKKIYPSNKTASKSVGMSQAAEIQLQPIKWRNFTNMKNTTTEIDRQ